MPRDHLGRKYEVSADGEVFSALDDQYTTTARCRDCGRTAEVLVVKTLPRCIDFVNGEEDAYCECGGEMEIQPARPLE